MRQCDKPVERLTKKKEHRKMLSKRHEIYYYSRALRNQRIFIKYCEQVDT